MIGQYIMIAAIAAPVAVMVVGIFALLIAEALDGDRSAVFILALVVLCAIGAALTAAGI